MPIDTINADDLVENVNRHIKIFAGPGAGKTRWLVNHIRHVLHVSKRLGSCRKIACITYTNVGVETIVNRLGNTADRVEISTIHSFLYKHIVKPYVHLIAAKYELDYLKVDGHDDIVLSNYSFLNEWKEKTSQKRIQTSDDLKVVNAWRDLRWKFDSNDNLTIVPQFPCKIQGYSVKTDSYLVYKKMMWAKGILHHDDVLFFSWQLVKSFPFLLTILRAKFAYFLVDEFQDTNPIQVRLLKEVAQSETTVAVIGDKAQSIYSFLGADHTQLDAFQLPDMDCYRIEGNHRSTKNIVKLLNHVRPDLTQLPQRGEQGDVVKIVVGDKIKAVLQIKALQSGEDIFCLTRDNLTNNKLRKGIDTNSAKKDLLDKLIQADSSNKDRRNSVISAIKAIEYAKQGFFKDAIKELRYFESVRGLAKEEKKKNSLVLLKRLIDNSVMYENGTLLDLINFITQNSLANLSNLRAGGTAQTFYSSTKFVDISAAIKHLDESGTYRTIHKSKGEEFDNVVLVIDKDENGNYDETKQLNFLLSPNLNDEENRIKYVAISRAKQNLFISVPSLSETVTKQLKELEIEIIQV